MAAGVIKDTDLTLTVADEEQRHSQERNRHRVTRFGNVRGNGQTGPCREQHGTLLHLELGRIRIVFIAKAVGCFNRAAHRRKVGCDGHIGLSPCAFRQG